MSYDPNAPSNPSYPPPPQNYGDGANSGNQPYGQQGYGNAPAYGSGGGPGYGGAPVPGQKNTLALVSMILGIASLVLIWLPIISLLGLLGAVVGLILGIIAVRKVNVLGGKGQAIAGIVCSAITLVIFVISVIAVGAILANN